MKRSPEIITRRDLKKLLGLARANMEKFFKRNPLYHEYCGKEVLIALCQGGAVHYIDRRNGVKDFDIWFFYPMMSHTLPYRRPVVPEDFGESKFGVHPEMKKKGFSGRAVDVLMRSDTFFSGKRPETEIVDYLLHKGSKTSKRLSEKAVIGLYPESVFGKTLWP